MVLCLAVVISGQTYYGYDWQSKSASDKRQVFDPVIGNDTTPGTFPSDLELPEIFLESMDTSFDWVGDDMPSQWFSRRPKLIHSVAVIADAKWVPLSNPYTGVFQGCDNLYVRLSLATAPTTGAGGYTPGLSLKCFRDGLHSGNMFAMYSLQGQDSWNFFQHDLTNHVPDLSSDASFILQELRKTFAAASAYPVMIGLSDLALHDQHGSNVTTPRFPFRLIFHPTTAIHNAFPSAPSTDPFETVLAKGLQNPGPLYEVWAQDLPTSTTFTRIGTLETTAPATTSNFGDVYMFFQHTRFEDDIKFVPGWAQAASDIMAYQRSVSGYTYPDLPWV
uniref:Uncharacterized protein n=1 Tax=Arcella intermedia TaxID=1963864 RepID=A0A6B2L9D6_9EUKA